MHKLMMMAAVLGGVCSLTQAATRPNILVLMAEDMSSRVGAFGDTVAVTPNLDQLAQQSVRYTNTFTAAGVCAPSRTAHITGMHQISVGGQHMRTSSAPIGGYKAVPPVEVKAYPELLRGAGYYTWTDQKLDYQFSGTQAGSGPFTIWNDEGSDGHWRNREAGQPFFGLMNFNVTHESGIMQTLGSWPNSAMHFAIQLVRAATMPAVEATAPTTPAQVILPPYYPDTPTVRADVAKHYNNIHAMDRQVGDVLAELKADGLLESTIVVWTTDHGDGLPRAKRDLFDSGIKVPMLIRWPEVYRPADVATNSIDTRLISFVDFAPTLLKLAGVTAPEYLQGQDFVNAAPREYIYASRDRIDTIADRQRAVRDERYKYIRSWLPEQPSGHKLPFRDNLDMVREMQALYATGKLNDAQSQWFEAPGEERLFDLKSDPFELNNLSASAQHHVTLARMRAALEQWLARVEDWSEESEATMLEGFNPGGEVPATQVPVISFADGRLLLNSATDGASLGYRVDDGDWQVYQSAVKVPAGASISAKAIRYGWQESGVKTLTAPVF